MASTPPLTPQHFVAKWQHAEAKECSAAQEHFIDLCRLLDHPTPMEADPAGASFTFDAGAAKHDGGQGWADVWKRGYFAWECKGQHANLDKAYSQLLQYRAEKAHAHQPLQRTSHVARPGAREAGCGCVRRPRLAVRFERRGDSRTAAGVEFGTGLVFNWAKTQIRSFVRHGRR